MRAQVIDLDPETNPKLKEILDLLLLAGYFRIRIPSITPFDKILGGLSWCITQSNFAIDIQYSEEFNIGQKIKVSEKIVKSLEEMSSPYKLQPHQIQGLDLNAIYPVIKWLIKFVLETREFRQDQNARVSKLVGKNSFQALQLQDEEEKKAIKEVVGQLDLIQDQRQTKNLKTLSKRDPLRVYSTLIEYGDLSSQKTYNKFCAAIAGIQKQKQTGGKQQQQQQLFDELTPAPKKDNNASITLEQLTNLQKDRTQQTQAQIKEMTQTAGPDADSTLNEEEGRKFQKLGRRNSITGQNIQQLISKDKIAEGLKETVEQEEMVVNLKVNEKQIAEQQLKLQQKSLANVERMLQQEEQELQYLEQVNQELEQSLSEETQRRNNILEALKVIEQKSKKANQAEIRKAEEKVLRIQELKEEKKLLKKEFKQEAQQLENLREEALQDIPEDDGETFRVLKQEYNQRKEKYEKKFLQFQQLNQEIAVLERKMESYPQLAEIAQYHQRFFELYDSINEEMEANKKQFMRYNNVQELKQLAAQFVEIMRTFKENYNNNLKDKKGKQELSKNLDQTYAQLQQQTNSYVEKVKVLDSKKQVSVEQYRQMLNLERDYFRLLKEIKFEKIVQYAPGLEPYNLEQEIQFDDIITSHFLKALYAFYEGNQYDELKLKINKQAQPLNLKLYPFMEEYLIKCLENKNFDILIQFIQGAHLFKAKYFQDLIDHCIAQLIYFKGSSDYDIKQFQKQWNLKESDVILRDVFVSKLQQKYKDSLEEKESDKPQQIQVDQQFFEDGEEEWE